MDQYPYGNFRDNPPGCMNNPMYQQPPLTVALSPDQHNYPLFYSSGGYAPAVVSSNLIAPIPDVLPPNPFYSNFSFPPPSYINNSVNSPDGNLCGYQPVYEIPVPHHPWQPVHMTQPCMLSHPHLGLPSQHTQMLIPSHHPQTGVVTQHPQASFVTHHSLAGAATHHLQAGLSPHDPPTDQFLQHVFVPKTYPESLLPEPTDGHGVFLINQKQDTNQKANRPNCNVNTKRDKFLFYAKHAAQREQQHNQGSKNKVWRQNTKQRQPQPLSLEDHFVIFEQQNGSQEVQSTTETYLNGSSEGNRDIQQKKHKVSENELNVIQLNHNGSEQEVVNFKEETVIQIDDSGAHLEEAIQKAHTGITQEMDVIQKAHTGTHEEPDVIQLEQNVIQLGNDVIQELQDLQLVDTQRGEEQNKMLPQPHTKPSPEEKRRPQHKYINKTHHGKQQKQPQVSLYEQAGNRQLRNFRSPPQKPQFDMYQNGRQHNHRRQTATNQQQTTTTRENPASHRIGKTRQPIQVAAKKTYDYKVASGTRGKYAYGHSEHGLIREIRNMETPHKYVFDAPEMLNGLDGSSRYYRNSYFARNPW